MRILLLTPFPMLAMTGCAPGPQEPAAAAAAVGCRPGSAPISTAISPDSARLEPFVSPFIERVGQVEGFSDLFIEHEPRWQVVATFTRPPPLETVARLAPAEIRDRIVVRSAKRTREDIAATRERIDERLRGSSLGGWTHGYNPRTECFEVTVPTAAEVERVRTLLPPDALADADVKVGAVPIPL